MGSNKEVVLLVTWDMISIVDYGMGNLQSVEKALVHVGAETRLVTDAAGISSAEKLVLPGVGAFGDAMEHLQDMGMVDALVEYAQSGRPMLGVCLGMQLMFDSSEEAPGLKGLGIFAGIVKRFSPDIGLKVPHMGWNNLHVKSGGTVLAGLGDEPFVYFVHSYYVAPAEGDVIAATAEYGEAFAAAVEKDNVAGVQFHPEKSQAVGLRILENFAAVPVLK